MGRKSTMKIVERTRPARGLDPKRKGEAGFSLIEALVAIVMLIAGLAAVSNLFIVGVSSNAVGNHSTAATAEATEVLERLKAIPFGNLVTGGSLTADTGVIPSPCVDNPPAVDCLVPNNFHAYKDVPGVGRIVTHWIIVDPGIPTLPSTTRFIEVWSESTGAIVGARSRSTFTTFRTCTAQGC